MSLINYLFNIIIIFLQKVYIIKLYKNQKDSNKDYADALGGILNYVSKEFEKNYEKYGYEFTDDNFVNWVNGNLVHTELQQAAIEINDKSFKYKKVSGFRIGEFSTTLRCDMKDLVNVNEIDVPRETLLNNTKQFVNKYIECQLQEI